MRSDAAGLLALLCRYPPPRARRRRSARPTCSTFAIPTRRLRFEVEVVDTDKGREQGLMFRECDAAVRRHAFRLRHAAAGGVLDEEHADPARHAVLRPTAVPLTHIHENARPHDLTPIPGGDDIRVRARDQRRDGQDARDRPWRRTPSPGGRPGTCGLALPGRVADFPFIAGGGKLEHPASGRGAAW